MFTRRVFARAACCHPLARVATSWGLPSSTPAAVATMCTTAGRGVGVALDIDGVLLRGRAALPSAAAALDLLDAHNVPWLLLTNGGGSLESKKAESVSSILGRHVPVEKVIVAHTPMKDLVDQYRDKTVLFTGRKHVLDVAQSYGFRNIVTVADLHRAEPTLYPDIPPPAADHHVGTVPYADGDRIHAAFVVMDPLVWERESQVLCDVLRSDGRLHTLVEGRQDVPLYYAGPDLLYAGEAPLPRFGSGAFLALLEALFEMAHGRPLEVARFGKPYTVTYDYTAAKLRAMMADGVEVTQLWGVGDNPETDIRGANNAGGPWKSALVRTGLFTGPGNDHTDPADVVTDDVLDAVQHILVEAGYPVQ